jgi:hypothetical protein
MEREGTCAEKGEGEGSNQPQYHMHFTGPIQAAAAAAEEEEDCVSVYVLKP